MSGPRFLVCGSREWADPYPISVVVGRLRGKEGAVLIHGCARGADSLAGRSAARMGVAVEEYPADWEKHGKAAGPIRNQRMLDEGRPDIVWAFATPSLAESRGTADMVRRAVAAGIPTYVTTPAPSSAALPCPGSPTNGGSDGE